MSKPKIMTAKYLYGTHKESSRRRGIKFQFTYEEWVAWWVKNLGPRWMKLRGHRSGQYVMARNGDSGPYAPHNVKCITANQNHSDTAKNGTSTTGIKNAQAKLTEADVKSIYLSTDDMFVTARKYGVHHDYVSRIRRGRGWKHITSELPKPSRLGRVKGERHHNAKVTAEIAKEIYKASGGLSQVAQHYGVSKSIVYAIKTKVTWSWATKELGRPVLLKGRGRRTDLL